MSETKVEGLKAKHMMVTKECRMNKGYQVALAEALDALNRSYQDLVHVDANLDVTYHFVLTVERS